MRYGVSNVQIYPRNAQPFPLPGVKSIGLKGSASVSRIGDDTRTETLYVSAPKEFSAEIETYSQLYPLDEPATITYEYISHGLAATGVILNAFLTVEDAPAQTMEETLDPGTYRYEVQTHPMLVNGRRTSHLMVELRLVGDSNYRKIVSDLIRQNEIEDVFDNLELEEREFKVVRDENGVWEVSGPGRYIKDDGSRWEISKVRNAQGYNGIFTLIDDY